MIKLKKINLYHLDYPLKNYVVASFGLMKSRPALILELTDTNDNVGLGEIWCNFPSDGASYKFKLFKKINNSIGDFEKKFWKAKSAESFNNNLPQNSKDPAVLIFKSAMAELLKTKRQSSAVQSARVGRVLEIATDNEMKKVEKNFTFLATVGSTAPFIGLFGTVWGIMNSFQSIAISRNTSLAIVAPGIAEALFATALGLLAAIPAVVAYNKFNSDSQRYFSRIENFSKRFLSII